MEKVILDFDEIMGDILQSVMGSSTNPNILRTSLEEEDAAYSVSIEAPGATNEMIEVLFKDDLLTIKIDYGTEKKNIRTGKYSWSHKFKNVDTGAIEAKLEAGILNVKLPKKPEAQPTKIKIN